MQCINVVIAELVMPLKARVARKSDNDHGGRDNQKSYETVNGPYTNAVENA